MNRAEAIEIIRKNMPSDKSLPVYEAIQTLVPELAESEDERIRKEISNLYSDIDGCITELLKARTNKDSEAEGKALFEMEGIMVGTLQDLSCIEDYLERQKEQKPADEAEEFFDSVESYNQGFVAGQKKMKEDIEKGFGISEHSLDYLAGRYAGYAAARQEQKPAEWNEEDNIGWEEAFACVTRTEKAAKNEEELQNAVTAEKWLKEIKFKYYVHPIKQELSEEDKDMLNSCISSIEEAKENRYAYKETDGDTSYDHEIAWLKSLRPSWKPSEEQMKAIKHAYNSFPNDCSTKSNLRLLYHDLEKLM